MTVDTLNQRVYCQIFGDESLSFSVKTPIWR